MTNATNIKEAIKEALDIPESDFDSHESDLYLLYSDERMQWLKENYEFYRNVIVFVGSGDWQGKRVIEIPFVLIDHIMAKGGIL